MLQAQRLEKYHGARALLAGVSLVLGAGERIGLVGRNGCGKSTLLRILAGKEAPDRGTVTSVPRGISLGYLPQTPEFRSNLPVMEAALEGLPPFVAE